MVSDQLIEVLLPESGAQAPAVAADLMQPRATIEPTEPTRRAAELLLESELRQLVVVGPDRKALGFVGESDIMGAHLESLTRVIERSTTSVRPAVSGGNSA